MPGKGETPPAFVFWRVGMGSKQREKEMGVAMEMKLGDAFH
jgi:hypothetical protein